MGGDYPASRWKKCPGDSAVPLPVEEATEATISKKASVSLRVNGCTGFPVGIVEQLLLAKGERQAQRYVAEGVERAGLMLGMVYGATSSAGETSEGSFAIIEFKLEGLNAAMLVLQNGPLVLNLSVLSEQRLVSGDYEEIAEAALQRVGRALLGE